MRYLARSMEWMRAMSVRYWKLLIPVALFLWPAAVFGQSPELMDAYNRVNELYAEGRYQEAIPFAEEALRLSEDECPSSKHLGHLSV